MKMIFFVRFCRLKTLAIALVMALSWVSCVSAGDDNLPKNTHLRLALKMFLQACAYGHNFQVCYDNNADKITQKPILRNSLAAIYALEASEYPGYDSLNNSLKYVERDPKLLSGAKAYPEWSYKFRHEDVSSYAVYLHSFVRVFCRSLDGMDRCHEGGETIKAVNDLYAAINTIALGEAALEQGFKERFEATVAEYISVFVIENPSYAKIVRDRAIVLISSEN